MKLNQLNYLFILFFILAQTANSQELWTATGAEAIVGRSSPYYTIGQITYRDKAQKTPSGLIDVQYVYEIYNLDLTENTEHIAVKLFPNATSSYLLLETDNYRKDNMSYQITDMQDRVLDKAPIKKATLTNNKTQIDVILLPISSYILSVFEDDEKVESFKIVKTNKY